MKNINEFIKEGHFNKIYKKDKLIKNTKEFEQKLFGELEAKDITCDIKFDSKIINLDILNYLKEGIVGHIVESVLCEVLNNLDTKYHIEIENAKNKHADISINGELWEIKAFNKEVKDDKIQHGISFTAYQIENEGNPIIFIQYTIKDNKINIINVYCRYPDEITYSKGTKSDRGTVVKFSL